MIRWIIEERFDFQIVNVSNVYEDPRFDPAVDEGVEFKHRNILCMPIKNSNGVVIGVIQVCWGS